MSVHSKAIRYFDAIRRAGSIRGAARLLHVDPAAVHRQLLSLEQDTDAPLFDRLPAGLRLTQAGEVFSRHVINVLQDEQRTAQELSRLQGIEQGEVRVISLEGLHVDFFPNVLETMLHRYPGVQVQIHTLGSSKAGDLIQSADADIGLAFAMSPNPQLHCVGMGRFQLGAIMAADHPLTAKDGITLEDCVQYPLLLANSNLTLRTQLDPLLVTLSTPISLRLQTDSSELMRQMAARGLGIAFHTRFGLTPLLDSGRLVYKALHDDMPTASLGIYVRTGRVLPPAVDMLANLLCDALRAESQRERRWFK